MVPCIFYSYLYSFVVHTIKTSPLLSTFKKFLNEKREHVKDLNVDTLAVKVKAFDCVKVIGLLNVGKSLL